MIKLSVLKNRLSGILSVWVPEFFSCFWYIVGWKPEYFSCLGYIVSCGYPTRTVPIPIPEEIQLLMSIKINDLQLNTKNVIENEIFISMRLN